MRTVTATPRHILMTTDVVGGVWTYAVDLAAAMAAHGTRTTLAVLGPGLTRVRRAEAETIPGIQVVETGLALDWLAKNEGDVLRAGCEIARLAESCRPEIIQLNSPALAAAARFPCPVIGACHSCLAGWWNAVRGGSMPPDFEWRSLLLARGYAACDILVSPSRAYGRETARLHGHGRMPEVVHNGRRAGPSGRHMDDFALTAGRLWDEGKDLATLDRAAGHIGLPVFAAGPVRGPNGSEIAFTQLRLLGSLESEPLRLLLARGPVFVSTARYEPFGLAVLEAAQAGCALVLSDIPTFRELWDGAAWFVQPGDDAGFGRAIRELLQDREHRSCLRVAARRRAQRFTASAMADGMAAIHARLLAGSTAQARSAAA